MLALELANDRAVPHIDLAFAVEGGHCLALTGPSGAGKTTVLRMIAGLRRPSSGRVTLGGRTLLDTESRIDLPPEQRRCGYVFQDEALFGHLNVWRNVAFGLHSAARGERRSRALELLARFALEDLADARIAAISGGERQRVALARALASEPSALLLDEPLSALDVQSRAHAAGEIARIVEEFAIPAVLVTHDYFEAALLGSTIAVIDNGEIVQRGDAAELAATPASAFVADLTGANLLRGSATARRDGLTSVLLDDGGELLSTDDLTGPVAVSVQPWEVTLRADGDGYGEAIANSARNALAGTITSLTPTGNRLRVALALPQPLVVDVTAEAAEQLGLRLGGWAVAQFKASATRLFAR